MPPGRWEHNDDMPILRVQDLRVAVRIIGKNRGAAALSVLSIALGIGLTTGVFSLADALYLRPLAIDRPAELLKAVSVGDDGSPFLYGWADYEDMCASAAGVADLAAYQRRGGMLANDEGGSDAVAVSPATPNFFSLIGVHAVAGQASFVTPDARPSAILGWRLWQRRFGGDTAIAGRTVLLSGKALTVAGVMPREFGGLGRGMNTDLWVSTDAWFDVLQRSDRKSRGDQFEIIARLKPGVSPDAAASRLDASIRGRGIRKPAPAGVRGTVLEPQFGGGWTSDLKLGGGLLAVLVLVLFIACANVAQLRLAQAAGRSREFAVRKALGARPSRIICQLLVETGMVAIPGAGLGLLLAHGLLAKAAEFLTPGQSVAVRLDARVLAFTVAATLLSVIMAGIAPARLAARLSIFDALKAQQGATPGRAGWRQTFLMSGQVAISVALVGGTLLFLESLRNAASIRPGFETGKTLLILNASPGLRLGPNAWAELVCDRLAALPGARAATFARRLPLSGSGGGATVRVEMPGQSPRAVGFNNVAGNYFAVMGTQVIAGRGIDTNDRAQTQPVVIVSGSFARQFLAGRNPLGQIISVQPAFSGGAPKQWQVVGVAADAPSNDLHESPKPFLYFAFAQMPVDDITLILDTVNAPATLARATNEEIHRFDADALLYGMTTLEQYMNEALAPDRLMSTTATSLGLFSIGLLAAGLFGALHYAVARRTRELGLRLALGATLSQIRRLILGEAVRIALWGISAGLALLAALAWLARSMFVGVSPANPTVYAGGAVVVFAIVIGAAWLPARRATCIEPMEALRSD
jgi:putative ABC transport system permease protein